MSTELEARFEAIGAALQAIADDIRLIKMETAGTSKAFHDVNGHLAVIAADIALASEQLVPIGTMIGELEARIIRLESQRLRSVPPPARDP
jgi:hypothetical protein